MVLLITVILPNVFIQGTCKKQESDEKLRRVESRKLEEAEMKIAELSETSEARICSLEEKILELSEMLGNAEKCKMNDQLTIQKLKEKNIQVRIFSQNVEVTEVILQPQLLQE